MRLPAWLHLHPRNLLVEPRARLLDSDQDGLAQIRIDGLVCAVCASRVQAALAATPGVESATCDLPSGLARVHFDATRIDAGDLPARAEGAVILMPLRRVLARVAGTRRLST